MSCLFDFVMLTELFAFAVRNYRIVENKIYSHFLML